MIRHLFSYLALCFFLITTTGYSTKYFIDRDPAITPSLDSAIKKCASCHNRYSFIDYFDRNLSNTNHLKGKLSTMTTALLNRMIAKGDFTPSEISALRFSIRLLS